jgi:hypothetical protein
MLRDPIEIEYLSYAKLIGHNYILTKDKSENIKEAYSKLKIPINNKFMSAKSLIDYASHENFIKKNNVYICNSCNSILLFFGNNVGFIKNNKFIIRQYIESINSDFFYLSCIEMQIKNLLE